jgi:hypothetical protein
MFTRIVWCSHPYCDDFYTQMSVVSSRNVILTRTNVTTTLTTVISTHSRVISTRRVWCWHIWVWSWHSYVLKLHSACRNHSCVWCSHASRPQKKNDDIFILFILVRTTTKSIQFINKPVFLLSFFPCWYFAFISKGATTKKRQFIYDLSMLCLGLGTHTVMNTRTSVISERKVWFQHGMSDCQIRRLERIQWRTRRIWFGLMRICGGSGGYPFDKTKAFVLNDWLLVLGLVKPNDFLMVRLMELHRIWNNSNCLPEWQIGGHTFLRSSTW